MKRYIKLSDDDLLFDDEMMAQFEADDEMMAEFEADQQRDQELLDQYGGAIRIWYSENVRGGKDGSYISPGTDVNQAVRDAVEQTSTKDPNAFIIIQVDLLEGYYDPESGMTEYDGEPVWRSGDSPTSKDMWYQAEDALKNLRLDTKEGWIREQASTYGIDEAAKQSIRDKGISEGRFKNDHEFDVLWNFAIDYDDDDIESSTAIEGRAPRHIQEHIENRSKAKQFLERFDDDFLSDLENSWKDYLRQLSLYYEAQEDKSYGEISSPNKYDWLSGLAEDYPDISLDELEDAWNCIEALDDSAIANS